MEKKITKLCNISTILLLTVIICIVAILTVPRLFKYDILAVLSGSMEPTFHVGSIIYIKEDIEPEEIKENDIITFKANNSVAVTHRVVDIDEDAKTFKTKGDANDIEDMEPVKFENFIGRADFSIPLIGFIAINIKTKIGIFGIATVFVAIILLQLIPEILKKEEEGDDSSESEKKH